MSLFDLSKNKGVLIVSQCPPAIGGVATFVENILSTNLISRYHFTLFDTHKGRRPLGNVFTLLKSVLGYPVHLLKGQERIVQIHASTGPLFFEYVYYVLLARLLGKRVIVRLGSSYMEDFFRKRSYRGLFFNRLDRLIVQSEYWRGFFKDFIPVQRIRIVPNVVSTTQTGPIDLGSKMRNREVVFLCGKDGHRKGAWDVVRCISTFRDDFQGLKFRCIASQGILIQYARENQITDLIEFLGDLTRKDLFAVLRRSLVFLLPSYSEGSPNILLEAMAMGNAVVTSNIRCLAHLIEVEKNGLVVEPGDLNQLREAILRLIHDRNLIKSMFQNNLHKIRDFYSLDALESAMEKVYDKF
jgi:glycosyltransferase involved in cell wall biosynthesis